MDRDDRILGYVQNRLGLSDRAQFEAEMAQDTSLAAEVALMQSVRTALEAGPTHEKADVVWDRLSSAIDPAPQIANDNRRPWLQVLQYAAVAGMAIAAWQVAVVPRITEEPGSFRAASEQSAAFVLQVKFVDTATLGALTDLLRAVDGTIIDGPSALGLVRVSFADLTMQQTAIDVFGSRSDLVEFALEE